LNIYPVLTLTFFSALFLAAASLTKLCSGGNAAGMQVHVRGKHIFIDNAVIPAVDPIAAGYAVCVTHPARVQQPGMVELMSLEQGALGEEGVLPCDLG
jgi:hypothetical protein